MFKNKILYHKTTQNRVGRELKEADIEAYGKKMFDAKGWMFEKFSSPEKRSVPDRMITAEANEHYKAGFIFFIEFKRPGKKATESQHIDHEKRREKGALVMCCDSYEEVNLAIEVADYAHRSGVVPELPNCLKT